MAHKITLKEKELKNEIKMTLKKLWELQKEKRVVADGQLFHLDMVNPRCLPVINSIMTKPNHLPSVIITEEKELHHLQNSQAKKNEMDNSVWTGEWSSEDDLKK